MLINDNMITSVKKLAMAMLKNSIFIDTVVRMNGYHLGSQYLNSFEKFTTAYLDVIEKFSVTLGILEEIIPKIKLMSKDNKISSINSRSIVKYNGYSEDVDYNRIDMTSFNYYINNSDFIKLSIELSSSYKESLDIIMSYSSHLGGEQFENEKEEIEAYTKIIDITDKLRGLISELSSAKSNHFRLLNDLDEVLPIIFKSTPSPADDIVLEKFILAYPSDISETIEAY